MVINRIRSTVDRFELKICWISYSHLRLCNYILGAEWIRTACPPRHLCHYGDGFILTYDITNEESFNQIRKIKTEIEKELNKKDIPMTIVAMKTDLENQVISYSR